LGTGVVGGLVLLKREPTAMSPRIEAVWLGGGQLAQLFNVTTMTIWRWERDPKLNFPPPKKTSTHSEYFAF
jgi:hypothetical protein